MVYGTQNTKSHLTFLNKKKHALWKATYERHTHIYVVIYVHKRVWLNKYEMSYEML